MPQTAADIARHAHPPVRRAVFVDPASRHLLELARRVAAADVTTLLVGPTGAGKEVLARVLHDASGRRGGPFVAINCAALPEQLIESQLFGHEKGAFTSAWRAHRGLFEQACGGTLFLDEIGEMPLALQSKLLRVLQERQVTRLGSEQAVPVDVRLVAATNRDLRAAIAQRAFREDLYHRIATFRLQLPPLRERRGDIVPIARQVLDAQPCPWGRWELDAAAQALLQAHPWPGNVRELENVVRRAVVLASGPCIGASALMFDDLLDVPLELPWPVPVQAPAVAPQPGAPALPLHVVAEPAGATPPPATAFAMPAPVPADARLPAGWPAGAAPEEAPPAAPASLPDSLQGAVRDSEHRLILAALAATRSKTEAAQRLGISPRTLRYKLAQLRSRAGAAEIAGSAA